MINKRYQAINNPLGFVMLKGKPFIHPVITCFEEFNDYQKEKLLYIKSVIVNKIGDCKIGVFGSQIRGNWDETSDYDIKVFKDVNKDDYTYLMNFDYGVKVDMFFSSRIDNIDNTNIIY